jgi:2,3-bisphosphoglycerate-independent phosphoglycerate mutase
MTNKKVALLILDGWGLGSVKEADAIASARTPVMDSLMKNHPHSTLITSGEDVGLPSGQMGNSEVGHLNIGAGRVVYQDLVKINVAIKDGSFFQEPVLTGLMKKAAESGSKLHLMGLVSDGGVHSHVQHLMALCDMAKAHRVERLRIHAFMDGRDTDPQSGLLYMQQLQTHLNKTNPSSKVASVIGRYYAMDRDKRWERVKKAYDLLVRGQGSYAVSAEQAIRDSYAAGVTDEFIEPVKLYKDNESKEHTIEENDFVICFNFRTDRCREITQVLTQQDMPEFTMKKLHLNYCTMTRYDEKFQGVSVVYEKDNLNATLGEVISENKRTQLRIAETEKYPHVTFFFSGGREETFPGEDRIMVPSPKVATYDLQPEMSAREITESVCRFMSEKAPDFICLNFANPDMVGHTGVFEAVVKAIETVDECLGKVIECGKLFEYSFVVIADHGNADFMINDDGSPNTAHSTNPVPVVIIDKNISTVKNGRLADVAPTILKLMNIPQPAEMTGVSLV